MQIVIFSLLLALQLCVSPLALGASSKAPKEPTDSLAKQELPLPSPTRPKGPPGPALSFQAFSDMNINTKGDYSNHTIMSVQKMQERRPAAILGLGDYIDGEKTNLSRATYIKMWESFAGRVLSPILNANIPFLASPGNHDAYYKAERAIYKEFWDENKPQVDYVDNSNYPFYYSFIQDGVFFVSLDDANYNTLYNRTNQLQWLAEQLSSPQAQQARLRVVYGHIPLYSIVSTKANSNTVYENGALKGERRRNGKFTLESILLDYHVDLVLFGHSHAHYAGHYSYADGRKLLVISLPCAGGSARYLVGTNIKTPYGFVEVNISEENVISYQYFNSQGQAQSLNSLPDSLNLDSTNNVRYLKLKSFQNHQH